MKISNKKLYKVEYGSYKYVWILANSISEVEGLVKEFVESDTKLLDEEGSLKKKESSDILGITRIQAPIIY